MYLYVFTAVLLGIHASNVNAQVNTTKYTVTLNMQTLGYRCAAGIINDKFLISSGECFASKMNQPIDVTSINAVAQGINGQIQVKVSAVYLPYFYAGRGRAVHDFAVVKLKESLNLRENGLWALRLPESNRANDYYEGVFASVRIPGQFDPEKVEVVGSQVCAAKAFNLLMPDSQFCVQFQNSSHKCSADKGSPVVKGDDLLIGVLLNCKDNLPYELVAKVSNFRDIIDAVVKGKTGPFSIHNFD